MNLHPPLELFYQAFHNRDASSMNALYDAEAVFRDPVFGQLNSDEAKAMWRMLLGNAGEDFQVEFKILRESENEGVVHWEARYILQSTGRKVHNRVRSHFQLHDGKILSQRDSFSFWRWSRQAFGPLGLFLGFTPVLQSKVRKEVRKRLELFIKKESLRNK